MLNTFTRTENVIRRLSQTPELLTKYGEIIKEQEHQGFIKKVDEMTTSDKKHYIPHHLVHEDSSATPIRFVYDFSCRESNNVPSLNACLMDRPPDLNDLTKIFDVFSSETSCHDNRY